MKLLHTVLFSLVCATGALPAQTPFRPIICGNDVFSDIVRTHYPGLHSAFEATFEAARTTPQNAADRAPLTVQVVVHVVWKEDAENLHDSIIHNQIDILNADFNRQNADTALLRAVFQPVAGKADIRFELAEIVRVKTNTLFEVNLFGNNLLPEVKHDADGGSDAWNTEQYLNIWICKIQPLSFGGLDLGQVLGFAFPPNNLPNWPPGLGAPTPGEDGVVIDYRMVGSNNPNPIEVPGGTGNLVVKGRTAVHEVGHYFGLRHIWGDGGAFGPNDCDQSDGVDDTPFANAQSEFDCDTTKNTCEQVEIFYEQDMPDLIENYMDYASEDCMNMFTQGQVTLMRNILQGPRSGLLMPVSTGNPLAENIPFRLSPNPASAQVSLDFHLPAPARVQIRLLDASGRVLDAQAERQYNSGNHRSTLNTAHLAPGVYFVELQTEQARRLQKLAIR
jgi:hypothetical protein